MIDIFFHYVSLSSNPYRNEQAYSSILGSSCPVHKLSVSMNYLSMFSVL